MLLPMAGILGEIDWAMTKFSLNASGYEPVGTVFEVVAGERYTLSVMLRDSSGTNLSCENEIGEYNNTFFFTFPDVQTTRKVPIIWPGQTCEQDALELVIELFSDINVPLIMVLHNESYVELNFSVATSTLSASLSGPVDQDLAAVVDEPCTLSVALLDQYGNFEKRACCTSCLSIKTNDPEVELTQIAAHWEGEYCRIECHFRGRTLKQHLRMCLSHNGNELLGQAQGEPWFTEIFGENATLSREAHLDLMLTEPKYQHWDLAFGIILIVTSVMVFVFYYECKRRKLWRNRLNDSIVKQQ